MGSIGTVTHSMNKLLQELQLGTGQVQAEQRVATDELCNSPKPLTAALAAARADVGQGWTRPGQINGGGGGGGEKMRTN